MTVLQHHQPIMNMDPRLNYDKILNDFEHFCDEFEGAAAKRFSGQDNDSRQPIKHEAVERVTPVVVKEVDVVGAEDLCIGEPSIDIQATEV